MNLALKITHPATDLTPKDGGEVVEDWSAELLAHRRDTIRRGLTTGSIEKRMSVLARCELALGHPLIDATSDELERWLDTHRVQPRTRYTYISHLAAFFRWAQMTDVADRDPTVRLVRPKIRNGLPRPLSVDEVRHLIDQAPTAEMSAMVHLAAHAGLRCMEIAALDAPDVMIHQIPPVVFVVNGKGGRSRVVPIGQQLITAVRTHGLPLHGPVFRKANGDRYQPWAISHALRTHMNACGVPGAGHRLRHTFATQFYRRSGDLRMTQEVLGHSSPTTTAIYTAWAQDKAAGVIDGMYS